MYCWLGLFKFIFADICVGWPRSVNAARYISQHKKHVSQNSNILYKRKLCFPVQKCISQYSNMFFPVQNMFQYKNTLEGEGTGNKSFLVSLYWSRYLLRWHSLVFHFGVPLNFAKGFLVYCGFVPVLLAVRRIIP